MKYNATHVHVGMVVSVHTSRAAARFRADGGTRRDKHSLRTSMHVACHACKKCMHECMDKHNGSEWGLLFTRTNTHAWKHTHTHQTKRNMHTGTHTHRNTHIHVHNNFTNVSNWLWINWTTRNSCTHIYIHTRIRLVQSWLFYLHIQREACNLDRLG